MTAANRNASMNTCASAFCAGASFCSAGSFGYFIAAVMGAIILASIIIMVHALLGVSILRVFLLAVLVAVISFILKKAGIRA